MKKRRVILFLLIGFIFSGVSAQKIEWKEKAKLPQPMRGAAVSSNNNIYFMEAHSKVSGVYEYNIVEDTWKKITNMILYMKEHWLNNIQQLTMYIENRAFSS